MNESNTLPEQVKQYFSARATLVGIGLKVKQMKLFEPITQKVKIAQKKVKFSPTEKLLDGFIGILAGAHGLVEINKRVRADPALQVAFGRNGCAEQSVVQDTLDACSAQNVAQMHEAMNEIYRRHSQGYRHNYQRQWQLLDIDLTGRPCGRKAAFASKGYFAHQRNRRGRQVGYVLATAYEEIVVKRLFAGKTQLTTALQPLVEAAEQTLALDEARRQRTIVRLDAGGGSLAQVNWLLARGYQYHGKDYSTSRAQNLAESVTEWVTDPTQPDRQVGWVRLEPQEYCGPVKRIAVRCRKKNGQWAVGVILSTLSAQTVLELTGQPLSHNQDPTLVLLAYVYFYDQRGGGVEIEIKQDKQGLGTTKRNKKRFEAQQIVLQLEALAHNTLIWARTWLTPTCPKVATFGIKRLIRDVLHFKLFAEAIEHVEPGPLEAATLTGANRLKVISYALLPDVLPSLASVALYFWEFNVRASTVLGVVGAGGIGQELKNSMDLLDFPRLLTVILIILVIVTVIDQLSAWLRQRLA